MAELQSGSSWRLKVKDGNYVLQLRVADEFYTSKALEQFVINGDTAAEILEWSENIPQEED